MVSQACGPVNGNRLSFVAVILSYHSQRRRSFLFLHGEVARATSESSVCHSPVNFRAHPHAYPRSLPLTPIRVDA